MSGDSAEKDVTPGTREDDDYGRPDAPARGAVPDALRHAGSATGAVPANHDGAIRGDLPGVLGSEQESPRLRLSADQHQAVVRRLVAVEVMAERAARKGYDLDPHEVLDAVRSARPLPPGVTP